MESIILYPLKYLTRPWRSLLFMGVHGNEPKSTCPPKNVPKPKTTIPTSTPSTTTLELSAASSNVAAPSTNTTGEIVTTSPESVTTSSQVVTMHLPSSTGGAIPKHPTPSTSAPSSLSLCPPDKRPDFYSPSQDDPRTGWVYLLRRHELESEMTKFNLSTEGNVDVLRKRLCAFIRNGRSNEDSQSGSLLNTAHFSHPVADPRLGESSYSSGLPSAHDTNVTYSLGPPILSTQLRALHGSEELSIREILGLPPNAAFRDVQDRLASLSRNDTNKCHTKLPTTSRFKPGLSEPAFQCEDAGPTQYLLSQRDNYRRPEPFGDMIPSVFQDGQRESLPEILSFRKTSTMDVAQVCNTVRKWGLKFDGNHDPVSFIERLNELVDSYEIPTEMLLKALPELFKGEALFWYRNTKTSWDNYDEFLTSFTEQYFPPDYLRNLDVEFSRRTQGDFEPIRKFTVALTTLMRRRGNFSVNDILNRLYSNMIPEYKLTMRRENFHSVKEFIQQAEGYETYLREKRNFRPPPNPSQALVPATAYRSDNRVQNMYKVDAVVTKSQKDGPQDNNLNLRDQSKPLTPPFQPNHGGTNHTSAQLKPSTNQHTAAREAEVSSRFRPSVSCWNCLKSGHVVRRMSFT